MVCLLAKVYLYAIKSSCQADVGHMIYDKIHSEFK